MLEQKRMEQVTRRVENESLPQWKRLQALFWLLGRICQEYRELRDIRNRLFSDHWHIAQDLQERFRDGYTTISGHSDKRNHRYGFRRHYAEAVNCRDGLPTSPIREQTWQEDRYADWQALCKEYNERLSYLQQWAHIVSGTRDDCLDLQPVSPACREALSILLVSQPHDKGFDGCVSEYHHSFGRDGDTGFHGEFLATFTSFRMDRCSKPWKRKRGGKRKTTLTEGRALSHRFSGSQVERESDPLLRKERDGTEIRYAQAWYGGACHLPSYKRADHCILRASGDKRPDLGLLGLARREGQESLSRLIRVSTPNLPYVPTLPLSRPQVVGSVQVRGIIVPILGFECAYVINERVKYIHTTEVRKGYCIAPARGNHSLTAGEWFHAEDREAAINRIDTIRERIELRERVEAREKQSRAEQRSMIAQYARKLNRAGSLTLADSQAAGNCQAGTMQFARQWGIQGTEVSAAWLLRRWKAENWQAHSLFLNVIDQADKRANQERLELAVDPAVREVMA